MARAKKQKIYPDRTTTAAYAASQPLFSALRKAINSLDSTKANLTAARDVVQSLHVHIANDDSCNDSSRHEAYMAAVTRAWLSSTHAFCMVFQELVNVTAAEPTVGREASPRHDEFLEFLTTVKRAMEQLEKSSMVPETGDEKSTNSLDSLHDAMEEVEPASYVNGSGKRPMVAAQGKAHRMKQEDVKAATRNAGEEQQGSPQEVEDQEDRTIADPVIEFEDVSAEVSARLKAKENKKAAEKGKGTKKKRKRESGDSVPSTAKEGVFEPLEALEKSLAEKRDKTSRKKAKLNIKDDTNLEANAAAAADTPAKKRKDNEMGFAGEKDFAKNVSQKKRKKVKT